MIRQSRSMVKGHSWHEGRGFFVCVFKCSRNNVCVFHFDMMLPSLMLMSGASHPPGGKQCSIILTHTVKVYMVWRLFSFFVLEPPDKINLKHVLCLQFNVKGK